MGDDEKDSAAKKRSEAAKKAAATRKANQEEPEETQRGGRKVGKQGGQSEPGPRGGRKVGKVEEYQPNRLPLQAAGLDQHAAEAERQAERDAAREEHNRRTGGGLYA